MTNEERHIAVLNRMLENMDVYDSIQPTTERKKAIKAAIKALSQVSQIEENIIKYMKKYPNHVGNIDFWEGFYACRNVVLQLDDEEYAPKEQQPCDDAISREAVIKGIEELKKSPWATANRSHGYEYLITEALDVVEDLCVKRLPSVTQKSGKWIDGKCNKDVVELEVESEEV